MLKIYSFEILFFIIASPVAVDLPAGHPKFEPPVPPQSTVLD